MSNVQLQYIESRVDGAPSADAAEAGGAAAHESSRTPDFKHAVSRASERLFEYGQHDDAYALLQSAREYFGPDPDLMVQLQRIYRSDVPRWHFSMLNDTERAHAYRRALTAAHLDGKRVLDIGAGTGLLSMMAADLGAKEVTACEVVRPIADIAAQIIARNRYHDRVRVIAKASTELQRGVDLNERADVLVTETFDCGFLGEGILRHVSHARENLLEPGALVLPRRAEVHAALVESESIFNLNRVSQVYHYDVALFNVFSTQTYFPVRLNTWTHRIMSGEQIIFQFDLQHGPLGPSTRADEFVALESGVVHGIVFWFRVWLINEITLSNHPRNIDSHWMQAFYCLPRPVEVSAGERLAAVFSHDLDSINIHLT